MFMAMPALRPTPLLRRLARLGGVAALLASVFGASSADAKTVYFPHQDSRFLYAFQKNGGAAVVPEGVSSEQPLPLVVFLHGTNSTAETHVWLGGGGAQVMFHSEF